MSPAKLLLSLALLLLGVAAWADEAPRYAVVPLQTLPGVETAYCNPTALNRSGEVVGMVGAQAVRWDVQGLPHRLATALALRDVEAINDAGQSLGYVSAGHTLDARLYLIDRDGQVHPLDKAHGLVLLVDTQAMGFTGGLALNDAGQIAFNTQGNIGVPRHGCLYDHGTLTDFGHLPLQSYQVAFCQVTVHALNSLGMAAGYSEVHAQPGDPDTYHAFLWRHGAMTDLGVPVGYDSSSATGLNDRGDVIGTMSTLAESQGNESMDMVHGFLWQNGQMTDLGTLPGCVYTQPTGINARGQIVGDSYRLKIDHNLPGGAIGISREGGALGGGVFLWQNGTMTDLQQQVPAGWDLQSAVAINDRGDILCTGYHAGMPSSALGNGAFLLRPLL